MSSQVKVEDFEVFRLFRVALLKFAQTVEQSLMAADGEIARTYSWLEGEQTTFWQGQLRKRSEAVTEARQAVRQKKLYTDASGSNRSAVEEEKALARCMAAVAHAQEKLEAIRKWLPRLQKAADLYRGGVSRLSTDMSADVPRAVALLDRLAARLEEYVQIETPVGIEAETAAASPVEGLMSRGADVEMQPAPNVAMEPAAKADDAAAPAAEVPPAPDPASPSETPPTTEDSHVASGL